MRGRTVLALVIASATFCTALAGLFVLPGSGPTVTVTEVSLVGGGGCGIIETQPGFAAAPGAEEHFSGQVDNNERGTCTILSIRSETPGFTVTGANVPLVVAPGTQTLSWLVQVPFFFSGNLTLDVSGFWTSNNPAPTNNSSCPSPCISSHVPSGLYFYSAGEVLPADWMLVEAGSVGTLVCAVAWVAPRTH